MWRSLSRIVEGDKLIYCEILIQNKHLKVLKIFAFSQATLQLLNVVGEVLGQEKALVLADKEHFP